MRSTIALLFSFGLLACYAAVAQEAFTIDQLRFKSSSTAFARKYGNHHLSRNARGIRIGSRNPGAHTHQGYSNHPRDYA